MDEVRNFAVQAAAIDMMLAARFGKPALDVNMLRSTLEKRLMRFKPEDYLVNMPREVKHANPVLEIHAREKHMRRVKQIVRVKDRPNIQQLPSTDDVATAFAKAQRFAKNFGAFVAAGDEHRRDVQNDMLGIAARFDMGTHAVDLNAPLMVAGHEVLGREQRPSNVSNAMHRQSYDKIIPGVNCHGIDAQELAAFAYAVGVGGATDNFVWSFAGNGAYSSAYYHRRTGLVVKVLRGSNPDGTGVWLQHCRDMRTSGHKKVWHPVVHGVYKMQTGYMAVMEPLRQVGTSDNASDLVATFEKWFSSDIACRQIRQTVPDGVLEDMIQFKNKLPFTMANGGRVDLHYGNVMYNEDGELVITDPFTGD